MFASISKKSLGRASSMPGSFATNRLVIFSQCNGYTGYPVFRTLGLISTNFGEAPVESMYGAAIITLEYVVTAVVEEPVTPRLTWLESLPNRACQPVGVKCLADFSTSEPPPRPCATGTLLSIVIGLVSGRAWKRARSRP